MNDKIKQAIRPQWLIMALAASSAVIGYRFSAVVVNILSVFTPIRFNFYFELILGLLSAFGFTYVQHRYLEKKSLRISKIFLIIFIALALLPLSLRIKRGPAEWTVFPKKQEISPVKLMCKIIDGDKIDGKVILTNQNILSATPCSYDGKAYQVSLILTHEGQAIIKKTTTANIGKRFGFWLNGDLKSSPEIKASITGGVITLPIDTSFAEAKKLAKGIMQVPKDSK